MHSVGTLALLCSLAIVKPSFSAFHESRDPSRPRQIELPALLGPVDLPTIPSNISNITVNIITFQDEIFDISSISVFGNINDGTNCSAETDNDEADSAILGPVILPSTTGNIRDISINVLTFGDEIFDISSISIFGDINDC